MARRVRQASLLHSCVTIVGELRGVLNLGAGGPLAQNLSDLYDYMIRRLLLANAKSDCACITEVAAAAGGHSQRLGRHRPGSPPHARGLTRQPAWWRTGCGPAMTQEIDSVAPVGSAEAGEFPASRENPAARDADGGHHRAQAQ